jgi:cell division protein ZapA (FtsZ GTPase activity inhibitor)
LAHPVSITIYGQTFSVVSGENPERVEELAQFVDQLMRSIASKGVVDSNRAAMLACLHLADEVQTLRSKLSQVKTASETKQKLNDLLSLLDDELEEAPKD